MIETGEYISRDAIYAKIERDIETFWTADGGGYYFAEDALPEIENFPAADVVPVIRAKWYVAERNSANVNKADSFYCDNCHCIEPSTMRFCPNCGAKMENGKDYTPRTFKDIALNYPPNGPANRRIGGITMREILFRGKRTDNGEWVYGIPASFRKIDNVVRVTMIPEIDGEHVMSECVCVDPETVGQFTGMYDHNGTRIFEGDIITDYEPDEGCTAAVGVPVVWHDAGFYVEYPTLFHILEREDCEYIEVIGNIHDEAARLYHAADATN